MFDANELRYRGVQPSADSAAEEANYHYTKMAREEMNAGREIPIVDVPIELGDMAITSVEAGDKCLREASTRRFMLSGIARENYDRIFRRGKHSEVKHVE